MPLSPWFMPGFLLVHVAVLVSKSALKPTESGLTCSRCMPKGRKRVIAPNRMGDVTCLLLRRPSESGGEAEAEDGFIGSPGSERGRCVTNRFYLSPSPFHSPFWARPLTCFCWRMRPRLDGLALLLLLTFPTNSSRVTWRPRARA